MSVVVVGCEWEVGGYCWTESCARFTFQVLPLLFVIGVTAVKQGASPFIPCHVSRGLLLCRRCSLSGRCPASSRVSLIRTRTRPHARTPIHTRTSRSQHGRARPHTPTHVHTHTQSHTHALAALNTHTHTHTRADKTISDPWRVLQGWRTSIDIVPIV